MRYLSVCSGIEAATVAWHSLGWTPAAFSEIEAFPSAVLTHHYPEVPNLGDMTKHEEWNLGPIDLLVGGTPCQSFSVAGLRKGLADPRGNLMLTFLAIAQRQRPRWIVWENVPGVLSSNGGRDFGTFLGALGELGYGFAYRVLDAQWFGVAQRRRRVFVVGCLGDWQRPAQVLFERESVRRDTAPSREKREAVAATIASRFGNSRNNHEELAWDENGVQKTVGTLCANTHPGAYSGQDAYTGRLVPHTFSTPAIGDIREDDVSSTITKNTGSGGETQNPAFVTTYAKTHKPMSATDAEGWSQIEAAPTVTHWPRDRSDTGTDVAVVQPIAFGYKDSGDDASNNVSPTLRSLGAYGANGGSQVAVAQSVTYGIDGEQNATEELIGTLRSHQSGGYEGARVAQPVGAFFAGQGAKAGGIAYDEHVSPTLKASDSPSAHIAMQVRCLTPVECERLQGFPDNYTNIPWRKKDDAPHGPRYKSLGNSMAVPVMRWIGKRIDVIDTIATQEAANE